MIFRIIDANLNRGAEGLRVLEDLARLGLNDAALSEGFRSLRHRLRQAAAPLEPRLLGERDVVGDVGAQAPPTPRPNPVTLCSANARRAEEALRVLEEMAPLPGVGLDGEVFRQARFALYSLEKGLLSRLGRRERAQKIAGLYVIIDGDFLRGRDEVEAGRASLRGGARVIQLRDKRRDKGVLLPIARALQELCSREGALFLVNDHLDLALASEAHGLHLGQTDLPLSVARQHLPPDRVIGVSTRTATQALRAQEEGADYVAVGSLFPTSTKEGAEVKGIGVLKEVRAAVSLPVVAIGGINHDNVAQVVQAGADAAAVISAVLGAEDIEAAARGLVQRMKEAALARK